MTRQNRKKLNRLLSLRPAGTVITHAQLKKEGISRQLINAYKKSGWVILLGAGASAVIGSKIDWSSGIAAIKKGYIHIGGKTALEILGYGHFLSMEQNNIIHIFAATGTRLPTWFQKYNWGNPISYHTTNFLSANLGLINKEYNNHFITISSAERAILEMLHLAPQGGSLEEADLLIESLTTLRPSLLQQLLEKCNSIKVKRLFLFLAERHNFSWLKKLNLEKVNLGKGKRVIVKGGYLDQKYQITVPKNFTVNKNNAI